MQLTNTSTQSNLYIGGIPNGYSDSDFVWIENFDVNPYWNLQNSNMTFGNNDFDSGAKGHIFDSGASVIYTPSSDFSVVMDALSNYNKSCSYNS